MFLQGCPEPHMLLTVTATFLYQPNIVHRENACDFGENGARPRDWFESIDRAARSDGPCQMIGVETEIRTDVHCLIASPDGAGDKVRVRARTKREFLCPTPPSMLELSGKPSR